MQMAIGIGPTEPTHGIIAILLIVIIAIILIVIIAILLIVMIAHVFFKALARLVATKERQLARTML